jgi:uncharacterized protein (DUF3820 family)
MRTIADRPVTYALYFGNRGFFPGELMAAAREELSRLLTSWGYGVLLMPAEAPATGPWRRSPRASSTPTG